jgi:hypothetical protein
MSIPLTGDGLYPFLEEIAGLSSAAPAVAAEPANPVPVTVAFH